MKSAAVLFALATVLVPTALRAADYCDDKIGPGETLHGKSMTVFSSIVSLALAERYCGAPPVSLSQIFVVVRESHGCGPRVRIEAEIKKTMENKDWTGPTTTDAVLRNLLAEENDVPQAEVDRRAKAAIEAEMGGCSELLKASQDFQERYLHPPKWPPEPEK